MNIALLVGQPHGRRVDQLADVERPRLGQGLQRLWEIGMFNAGLMGGNYIGLQQG